jgi:hypothetical protein
LLKENKMNEFRLRSNGDILSEQQVRESVNALLPSVLDSATCDVLGIDPILKSPEPTAAKHQQVVRDGVEQDNLGNWVEKWTLVDFADEVLSDMLARAKADKGKYINQCRYNANFTSFNFEGKSIACDQLSRSDIESTNAQIMKHAALPTGWPGGWKAIDNTYVIIDTIEKWNSFYDAMYATGMANFAKAQQLKAQLDVATLETVDSINW